MVMMAVTTHAPRKRAGELVPRAMSASTRKMPDPIMDPATMAVELNSPRLCTNPVVLAGVTNSEDGVRFEVRHLARFYPK